MHPTSRAPSPIAEGVKAMYTLSQTEVDLFYERGFHVARDVFSDGEIARLREGYDYILALAGRSDLPENLLQGTNSDVHIHLQPPQSLPRAQAVQHLRKVQWPARLHPVFEEIRTSPRLLALLEPLLGTSLKQYINQINFKLPGSRIDFPWHQDVRPTPAFTDQVRTYVQTIISVDEASQESGCIYVVPGSHRLGDLKAKRYAEGQIEDKIDVHTAIPCLTEPGDVLMFTPYTVHGSKPNTSHRPRRSYINGFVRADARTVGKWAFLDGQPVPITGDRDYSVFWPVG